MNEEHKHIIREFKMDALYLSGNMGYALQERLSNLFHHHLSAVTERALNMMSPEGQVYAIEQLEVDLGTVAEEDLEALLPERLLQALKDALTPLLSEQEHALPAQTEIVTTKKTVDRRYELLEYYLVTGAVPWWANEAEREHPDTLVRQLLQEDTERLPAFLLEIAKRPQARKRMVYQFSEETIRDIITLLAPAESAFIFEYSVGIVKVQQKKQVVQTESDELQKAVWLFILRYLAEEHGNEFNRRQFLRSNLNALARHFNTSYQQLLQLFYDGLQNYQHTIAPTGLIYFITQLYKEDTPPGSEKEVENTGITEDNADDPLIQLSVLQYYIQHGSLPYWAKYYTRNELRELADTLGEKRMYQLATWWKSSLTYQEQRDRMKDVFSESLQHTLLTWAYEDKAALLKYHFEQLQEWYSSNLVTSLQQRSLVAELWDEIAIAPQQDPATWLARQLHKMWCRYPDQIRVAIDKQLELQQYNISTPGTVQQWEQLLTNVMQKDHENSDLPATAFSAVSEVGTYDGLLKDLLLYQLITGTIPWWGKQYAHYAIDSLIRQLLEQRPRDVVAVMRYVAPNQLIVARILSQVRIDTLFMIMAVTDTQALTARSYEILYNSILNNVSLFRITAAQWRASLIQAIWQSWLQTTDTSLEPQLVLKTVLTRLAGETAITFPVICYVWKQALRTIQIQDTLISDYFIWLDKWSKVDERVEEQARELARNRETEILKEPQWLWNMVLSGYTQQQDRRDDAAARPALEWLQHYLLYGQLPSEAGTYSVYVTSWLTGRLLVWLQAFFPGLLRERKTSWNTQPALPHHLLKLLSIPDTQVKILVENWLSDLLELSWITVASEEKTSNERSQLTATVIAAGPNLLRKLRQFDTLNTTEEKEALLLEIKNLLRHFLLTGNGTEGWTMLPLSVRNEILSLALLLLYRQQPSQIQTLLDTPGQQLDARLQLFALFTDTANNNVPVILKQQLTTYEQNDQLKWWAEIQSPAATGGERLDDLISLVKDTRKKNRQERQHIYKLLLRQQSMIRLLATQLDKDTFREMLSDADGHATYQLSDAYTSWQTYFAGIITDSYESERLQTLFREYNLWLLTGECFITGTMEYIQQFLQWLSNREIRTSRYLVNKLSAAYEEQNRSSNVSYTGSAATVIGKVLAEIYPAIIATQRLLIQQEESRQYLSKHRLQGPEDTTPDTSRKAEEEQSVMEEQLPAPPDIRDEKLYVNNAGLILLHPFLPFCFTQLGWLQDGQFIDEIAQQRAIHLLQYMACGQEGHAEHLLTLNKIMCNYPLEETLPYEVGLTAAEKAMADQLITVVMNNWDTMKNASLDGFRGSFLIRDGALWQEEEDWWLRVEPRGYDVLLQSLPWGIGMIKNTWMTNYIHSEWAYN